MVIDGIVLAGGAGRRFGAPKATVTLGGTPLVELAVRTLMAHCRRTVVVGRHEIALPPLQVEVLHDRPGPDAPINALATALPVLEAPAVLVLACDLPCVGPVLPRLLAHPGAGAVVAADADGHRQPLCARYPRAEVLEVIERRLAEGALSMMGVLHALGVADVPATADELLNVNSPLDLARAAALRGCREATDPGR